MMFEEWWVQVTEPFNDGSIASELFFRSSDKNNIKMAWDAAVAETKRRAVEIIMSLQEFYAWRKYAKDHEDLYLDNAQKWLVKAIKEME